MLAIVKIVAISISALFLVSTSYGGLFQEPTKRQMSQRVDVKQKQIAWLDRHSTRSIHRTGQRRSSVGFYPTGRIHRPFAAGIHRADRVHRVGRDIQLKYSPWLRPYPSSRYRRHYRYPYDSANYYPYFYGFGGSGFYISIGSDYYGDPYGPNINWRWANYGNYPYGAIIIGYDNDARPIYNCRASYQQSIYYGRAIGRFCHIRYDNRTVKISRFKVQVRY